MRLTFPINDRTINNDHFFVMLDTLSSLVLLSIHAIILFRIYLYMRGVCWSQKKLDTPVWLNCRRIHHERCYLCNENETQEITAEILAIILYCIGLIKSLNYHFRAWTKIYKTRQTSWKLEYNTKYNTWAENNTAIENKILTKYGRKCILGTSCGHVLTFEVSRIREKITQTRNLQSCFD